MGSEGGRSMDLGCRLVDLVDRWGFGSLVSCASVNGAREIYTWKGDWIVLC